MIVYVDPRLIGKDNYIKLQKEFPNIDFVTEIRNPQELEILFAMPKIVKEMKLSDYPNLRWIQYLMAGYDGVDIKALNDAGITFSNAQDIFSKSIAEDVFTKILFFNRNVRYYVKAMTEGRWEPIREEPELTGSTVLILGVGSIGKELARRFKAFEMNVIGYRKNALEENYFDQIITTDEELFSTLPKADYVVLALPLNEQTRYMFDKKKFSLMKHTALFINVARGTVVNQDDLVQALKEKTIRGAGLDVLDPEPLPSSHPLWSMENVYITPHNASSSPYMRDRLYRMIVMNLKRYISGEEVLYQISGSNKPLT